MSFNYKKTKENKFNYKKMLNNWNNSLKKQNKINLGLINNEKIHIRKYYRNVNRMERNKKMDLIEMWDKRLNN